jgi:carboxymethylenebutenolidase
MPNALRFVVTMFTAALLTACGPSTTAQKPSIATAPPAKGQTVPLAGNGSGWLALPTDTTKKHGAVIVLQEWWGLNDWIKQNTARFAANGYVALAVDLYRGNVALDKDTAHELMRGLPEDRALADMRAGFELLAARPDVDPERIAVVGWCMGGGYSLALAVAEPRLRAAVIN